MLKSGTRRRLNCLKCLQQQQEGCIAIPSISRHKRRRMLPGTYLMQWGLHPTTSSATLLQSLETRALGDQRWLTPSVKLSGVVSTDGHLYSGHVKQLRPAWTATTVPWRHLAMRWQPKLGGSKSRVATQASSLQLILPRYCVDSYVGIWFTV